MSDKKKNNDKYNQTKKQKWLCSECSHELASLANESIVVFYKEGREFYITYDHMNTNCPKCSSVQIKESPLLRVAIEKTTEKIPHNKKQIVWNLNSLNELFAKIRIKAWGVKDFSDFMRMFPHESVVMPNKEKSRFITSLSENQRRAYKIMCDMFSGEVGDPNTTEGIQEKLALSPSEAALLHNVVLEKLRDFRRENSEWLIHS